MNVRPQPILNRNSTSSGLITPRSFGAPYQYQPPSAILSPSPSQPNFGTGRSPNPGNHIFAPGGNVWGAQPPGRIPILAGAGVPGTYQQSPSAPGQVYNTGPNLPVQQDGPGMTTVSTVPPLEINGGGFQPSYTTNKSYTSSPYGNNILNGLFT